MKEERLLTRSGYNITIQIINDSINHLIIRDTNLYIDFDSRSKENREWLIPINNINDIKGIINILQSII